MRVLRIMLVFIVLVIGRNASAELRVCNDTPFRLSTAVGYYENGNWVSKGWYWVDAGDCIVPLAFSFVAQRRRRLEPRFNF